MSRLRPSIAHPGVASPSGIPTLVAAYQRKKMYAMFIDYSEVHEGETIADIGATSDQVLDSSNYLEAWYPFKKDITAVGIDDASFLEKKYLGMTFVNANGLNLPFEDNSFDIVHSSAVLEHVGSSENQQQFVKECARVARRSVFFTTPNRWFPIEFHTVLPLIHWLPKPVHRALLNKLNIEFLASEQNLNLMSKSELIDIGREIPKFEFKVSSAKLGGWPSNLILFGKRLMSRPGFSD